MSDAVVDAADEDRRVIELLRTPGLSIKYLDEETKERIRCFIHRTHVEKDVSLSDMAKLIGNKTSGYTSWLTRQLGIQPRAFEEARLKGIKEKRRKYERKPFDGTEDDRAYILGLRHGDLSVSTPWTTTVRVSTSTTHPALADLFTSLFSSFGHVYRHPRYKKDTRSYEWNLSTSLDRSFDFLTGTRDLDWQFASQRESRVLSYLAGLLDAEGSISLYADGQNTSLMVTYYNTDIALLDFVCKCAQELGFHPVGPYLDKRKGTRTSKYQIERKKDYYKLVFAKFEESQEVLRRLPIRHAEKTARKELALTLSYREPWPNVQNRVEGLRRFVHESRDRFVDEARIQYVNSHTPKETKLPRPCE